MSVSSYYANLYDCNGNYIKTISTFLSIEYGRQKNQIGAATLVLPGSIEDINDYTEDCMIELFRYNRGRFEVVGETIWIFQSLKYDVKNNCDEILELVFMDTISILTRRYNMWLLHTNPVPTLDYPSHTNRACSDTILQLYNHNFGINTQLPIASMNQDLPPPVVLVGIGAANRQITAISANSLPVTLESPIVPMETAWKEVLASMIEAANISENAGIPIWFDIVYTAGAKNTIGSFTFQIWEKNRGTIQDLTFGSEYGNLENTTYVLDFSGKKNVIVAIGDELLDSDPALDEVMTGLALGRDYLDCLFHGKELVVEQRKTTDDSSYETNALSSYAKSQLYANKEIRKITGDIINIEGQSFFTDFAYGDVVSVFFKGQEFLAEINKFSVKVDEKGEDITIPIESTTLVY